MSGGEFDVPGGVLRGAGSRGPQFTPPQRFATFALRLGPFAWEFCDGAPVCGENDAFPERKGDLNFGNEHRSAAKTMPGFGDAGTCAEIIVSLQTGAPLRKFRSPFRSGKLGAYCRLSISNDSGLQTVTVKRFWIADLHTQAILNCNRLLVHQLHPVPDASSAVTCSSVVCSDSFTSCRFRCSSGSCVVAIRLCPSQRTLPREESPEGDTGAS